MERDRIKTPQRLLFFSADTTSPIMNSTGAQCNFVFLAFLTYPVNNYGLFSQYSLDKYMLGWYADTI